MFWMGASTGKVLELGSCSDGVRHSRKVRMGEAGRAGGTCLWRGRPGCRVLEATVKVLSFVSSFMGRCWKVLAGE